MVAGLLGLLIVYGILLYAGPLRFTPDEECPLDRWLRRTL